MSRNTNSKINYFCAAGLLLLIISLFSVIGYSPVNKMPGGGDVYYKNNLSGEWCDQHGNPISNEKRKEFDSIIQKHIMDNKVQEEINLHHLK